MNKETEQHLRRERATYQYLDALEAGDIDTMIDVLQQAVYDASLEESVLGAHQAYFQADQASLSRLEMPLEMPSAGYSTLRSGVQPKHSKRRPSQWLQVVAAVLIVGALVGGLVRFLMVLQPGAAHVHITPTPTVVACKPQPWQIMDLNIQGKLAGIAALTPTDAWAVGKRSVNTDDGLPLIEHWDGQKWSTMPNPTPQDGLGALGAVAAITADNVWAVGEQYKSSGDGEMLVEHTLIEHWDGYQWAIVPSPTLKVGSNIINTLESIAAVSANDIWTVGGMTDLGYSAQGVVEHWDGERWSLMPDISKQLLGAIDAPRQVNFIEGGKVFISGGKIVSDSWHPLVERWDGQKWDEIDTTSLGQNSISIESLGAVAENDIWAIVHYAQASGNQVPVNWTQLEHWNGQQWSKVSVPDWMINANTRTITHIVTIAANDVWAIGNAVVDGGKRLQPLVAHWNGKSWEQVSVPSVFPNHVSASFQVLDLVVLHGTSWLVGFAQDYAQKTYTIYPVLEQQITCS